MLEYFDHGHAALAEACQDEGSAAAEVAEVVVEGIHYVAHGQRAAGSDKAVGGKGLQGALPIEGGEEIETAGEEGVDSYHLAQQGLTEAVEVGVREVAVETVEFVVAYLGGDDVEDIDGSLAVDDVPLGGVVIVGDGRCGLLCDGADGVVPTGGKE